MANSDIIEYPDGMVLHDNRAIGYFTAALRAGVACVREIMNQPEYLALLGLDSIPVEMDAPDEMQSYPYIHVMYGSKKIEPISLDASDYAYYKSGTDEHEDWYDLYRFQGEYTINVYATSILERETIADVCIAAMAIDRRFRKMLVDNPYIAISPNMSTFDSFTANESWGTPWSADEQTAFRNFKFSVVGEFLYRYDTAVEFITNMKPIVTEIG